MDDNLNIKSVHPLLWMAGWIFYIGTLLFFIYWVLAWGLSNCKYYKYKHSVFHI